MARLSDIKRSIEERSFCLNCNSKGLEFIMIDGLTGIRVEGKIFPQRFYGYCPFCGKYNEWIDLQSAEENTLEMEKEGDVWVIKASQ